MQTGGGPVLGVAVHLYEESLKALWYVDDGFGLETVWNDGGA